MNDREKLREYQRVWMAQRRAEFFAGKCCVECGSIEDLQLARLESGLSLRGIWSWAAERRNKVLEQCRVLCAKHGKKDRSVRRGAVVMHGTEWMYQSRHCRCPECVAAASVARQRRRGK